MSANQFFLAKGGRTSGPYTEGQIERMRETGEYQAYSWFWHPDSSEWQPIDPPPAPPVAVASAENGRRTPAAPALSVSDETLTSFSALCYDPLSVLAGVLRNVTDGGCDFIVSDGGASPAFAPRLPVVMNILDFGTSRAMSVSGRVGGASRKDGSWSYRIHWKRCPEILREKLAGHGRAANRMAG